MIRNFAATIAVLLAFLLVNQSDTVSAAAKKAHSSIADFRSNVGKNNASEVFAIQFQERPNLFAGAPVISGSSVLGNVKRIVEGSNDSTCLLYTSPSPRD